MAPLLVEKGAPESFGVAHRAPHVQYAVPLSGSRGWGGDIIPGVQFFLESVITHSVLLSTEE